MFMARESSDEVLHTRTVVSQSILISCALSTLLGVPASGGTLEDDSLAIAINYFGTVDLQIAAILWCHVSELYRDMCS